MIPRTFREEMILWSFRVLPHVQENLVRSGWTAIHSVVEPVPHIIKTVAPKDFKVYTVSAPQASGARDMGVCLTVA